MGVGRTQKKGGKTEGPASLKLNRYLSAVGGYSEYNLGLEIKRKERTWGE